ncbi:hypothetical protein [Dactylosporangium aurantiacum]|nr:hypothetical protein [Dactylosporangium aurantiacum]
MFMAIAAWTCTSAVWSGPVSSRGGDVVPGEQVLGVVAALATWRTMSEAAGWIDGQWPLSDTVDSPDEGRPSNRDAVAARLVARYDDKVGV